MPLSEDAYNNIKEKIRAKIVERAANRVSFVEVEAHWRTWLRELFPKYITEFAQYHVDFWEWVWAVEPGKQPRTFVAIWPRAGGKSTSAELAAVALGARKVRRYILYVSATQEQADDHVQNVGALLESSSVERYYPDLATRALNKFGSSKGWRRNRLRTQSGFTIDALGLDTAQRGVKLEEQRPDCIIVDDIDEETDSLPLTEKKIKILTRALIPAGASDVAILFVQNLVHKDSVFSRLVTGDGRADFLADRIVSGPTPALKNFTFEREDSGRYVITSGLPTWSEMGLDRCQEMIDDMGLLAFRAECQHEVDLIGAEKDFREFNEIYHVVTWSEYAAGFDRIGANVRDTNGRPWIPQRWLKGRGLDWGTTPEHPTAVHHVAVPSEAEPLHTKKFVYREIVRPTWPPADPHGTVEVVSPGRIASAIRDAERPWAEVMASSLMSHEASAALNTFIVDLPEDLRVFFSKWKPRRGSGVPQVQEALTIDYSKPHPFRRYPQGYVTLDGDLSGQPIMGCPSLFLIVEDGQGELYVDNEDMLRVRGATNERGMARLRAEMPVYNQYNTGQSKIFDDSVNGLCGLANTFFVPAASLTRDERVERQLEKVFKGRSFSDIMELPPIERDGAIHAYRAKQEELLKADKGKVLVAGVARWRKRKSGTW